MTTSLKTSICFDGRKNNIGTFYAPLKILIDTTFCKTLPRGELFSGRRSSFSKESKCATAAWG